MNNKIIWELIKPNGVIYNKEIIFKEIIFKKDIILIKCDGYTTTRDYKWLIDYKAKIV